MDKKYICYLTEKGVQNLIKERDAILNEKLPQLRCGSHDYVKANKNNRKSLLKRVLYLNRLLNYNSNQETCIKGVIG